MLQFLEDVEKAITYNHKGHLDRFISLDNRAMAVLKRCWGSSKTEGLEEVITSYRELKFCSLDHPYRCITLNTLANIVLTRYCQLGGMEHLDEAITYNREALTLRPIGHPDRHTHLSSLATTLLARFRQSGRMEDLDDSITYNCEALSLCPLGHPKRSLSLSNLANSLLARFRKSGRMEDLDDSITYNCEALSLCPLGHPKRFLSLRNLPIALLVRFNQSGRMEDLEDSITYSREALIPVGDPNRSSHLNSLGIAVLARFRQLGRMEDLDNSITYSYEALSLCPLGHPERFLSLSNLASALLVRFNQSGRMEDLEDSITCNREALTLHPVGDPNRSSHLNSLGVAVLARFEQSGRMKDLDEAITSHREALEISHSDRPTILNNLACAVFDRYRQLGRMADLKKAIKWYQEVLTFHPPGHPDRSIILNNLANAVCDRYQQSYRMEDLQKVITYNREALTLRPPGHPDHSSSLNDLARALLARYIQLGRMEDLETVITSHREVLMLLPLGHPGRPNALNYLAHALIECYKKLGRMEDLNEAITYSREALTLRPLDHPCRLNSLQDLATAVLICYEQSGKMEDLEESFMLYEQALNQLPASSMRRLQTAILLVKAAQLHRHSSLVHAYSMALHFLNCCLISYPNIDSKQRFLATVRIPKSLACDAAAAAISQNNLEAAVELLEQGRAMLWSKMAGYRSLLDQLRQVDKLLADKFEMLSGQLERLESEISTSPVHVEAQMQRSYILSEEWEETVGQIRKIKDFSNFLQAVPFTTLRTAAAEGPIILINISHARSDAIILHIDNPPILVTLPDVQPEYLISLAKKLAFATQSGAVTNSQQLIIPILRDLWNDIVSPVCDSLRKLAVPEKSRIWWCPTSQSCGLPLHAAGPYRRQQKNLPDLYTSSYIVTMSALIKARSNMIDQTIVPKLLVIGQPETLPSVQDEIDNIRQLGDFVDVMVSADASRETVLRGLQQHTWAHFACHGRLGENSQPFHASFELHGGSFLTLLDLIQAKLPNAELAFLSACHGATGDSSTPDETIHLAAAFQFCGFRSVVGTLWEMSDVDGPIMSKEFYKYMFRKPGIKADFRDSAKALNLATGVMRKNGVPVERWIMFVHIGA